MIKSSKCAIFSDIHIGVHRDDSMWHRITLDWVRWFKSELDKSNINDVIFTGDFFHYRDSIATNTLSHASTVLDILKDKNMIFITGNHDCYYKESSEINSISIFNGRENITVIDKPFSYKTPAGKNIFFAPWGTPVEDIQECDILFGHFEIETFKLNSFKICDHGLTTDSVYNKSPLTITGHFHHKSLRETSEGTILYVGSPFQMDFGDQGSEKGFYSIDLDTSKLNFTVNNLSPVFHKLHLSELVKANATISDLKKRVEGNIIKLIIDQRISSTDSDFLFQQIRALRPIRLDVDHDINFDIIIDEENSHDFSGIDVSQAITEFINIMDIDNKSPVVEYVLDVYNRASNQ